METLSVSEGLETHVADFPAEPAVDFSDGLVLALVHAIDPDGQVLLRLPARDGRPVPAAGRLCRLSSLFQDARVAVMFLHGDPSLPLILGPIQVEDDTTTAAATTPSVPDEIKLEARDQVTLRCGKASIQLQKDGSVLIRGQHVLSRASGTNRIRGANVQIN